MAGAFVQGSHTDNLGYVNTSPSAGNSLAIQIYNSDGDGDGSITSVQAMSATNGGGSVLATFTIPASLAILACGSLHSTSAYLLNTPSSVLSLKINFNGVTVPGTSRINTAEVSGVAAFLIGARQWNATPGVLADAISSSAASVSSIPAYILGICGGESEGDVAAGTNFTARVTPANSYAIEDRRETGATGSYAATATASIHGLTDSYVMTMLAFSETPADVLYPQVCL